MISFIQIHLALALVSQMQQQQQQLVMLHLQVEGSASRRCMQGADIKQQNERFNLKIKKSIRSARQNVIIQKIHLRSSALE